MHGASLEKATPLGYYEVENVPSSVLTRVLYIGELKTSCFISQIVCSGSIYAKFSVFLNEEKIGTKRSGPERNCEFNFKIPIFCKNGSNLEIKAIHYKADQLADFECGVFAAYELVA